MKTLRPSRRKTGRVGLGAAAILWVSAGIVSSPGSAVGQLTWSPDVTVSIAGTVVADEDAAEDDLLGSVGLADLDSLPAAAEVDA
ncbi:MAG: hypothetical protein ACX98W_18350, partial [bacterium]